MRLSDLGTDYIVPRCIATVEYLQRHHGYRVPQEDIEFLRLEVVPGSRYGEYDAKIDQKDRLLMRHIAKVYSSMLGISDAKATLGQVVKYLAARANKCVVLNTIQVIKTNRIMKEDWRKELEEIDWGNEFEEF